MPRRRWAGVAAMSGPVVFLAVALVASALQAGFMRELGWDIWPSGLALGPYGWLQMVNFAIFGVALLVAGIGLWGIVSTRLAKVAAFLLATSGAGMFLAIAKVDADPAMPTVQGTVHDIGYFVFIICLLFSYVLLAIGLRGRPLLAGYKRYFLLALVPIPLGFLTIYPQVIANVFLFSVPLVPLVVIGMGLMRSSEPTTGGARAESERTGRPVGGAPAS